MTSPDAMRLLEEAGKIIIERDAAIEVAARPFNERLAMLADRISGGGNGSHSREKKVSAPTLAPDPGKNADEGKIPKPGTQSRRMLDALFSLGGHADHAHVAGRTFSTERPTPQEVQSVRAMMASFKKRGLVGKGKAPGWTKLSGWARDALNPDGRLPL